MTLAEGGWYGSHFPSRCSSCFPQTQQRHEISLTSDSEKVDNHFFVLPSSLGKAAAYYSIMSKIIPIRLWYEYWNISLICAQHCSLNMPIVSTVSITYFKWHGMIIYVNITSAEAEWCLAKQERLSAPWALVSRKRVPRGFREMLTVTERSELDWPMGAAAVKKPGSLPLTHLKSCKPQTSSSILWQKEGGWKACLRVWNSKREESGRKGRQLTGYSFRTHE